MATQRERDMKSNGVLKENSPSHIRACLEEDHHGRQKTRFIMPFSIYPFPPGGASLRLDFRDFLRRNTARMLNRLTPDDCRIFCFKDCAIYSHTGFGLGDRLDLMEEIYREWFPHRAQEQDISDGSFFGVFLSFEPEAYGTLQDTLRFHNELCGKLEQLEKAIPAEVPVEEAFAIMNPGPLRRVEYKLRRTFPLVFMTVEVGWQKDGVLLVWKSEDDALRHNCAEDGEISRCTGQGYNDLGHWCAFRCPLQRAMRLVVSTDVERSKPRGEFNWIFEETLGEVDG
ncbi:MAG: hypothetical protein M1820_004193 [Bogoriella megaspora]|nr:MAG: hypothetical protein M1820_004193 [Bogoriella megaspora]